MEQAVSFLAAPFVMTLILVGIHCYLGLHVLARGVIFVDLALAQVAALGSVLSLMLAHEHEMGSSSYAISLLATIIAALFFSLSNRFKEKIPQEAMIGITYAFASAALVLFLDKAAHGTEHMKASIVGQLLWVTWKDVLRVAVIYGGVSVVHFLFRKQLLKNSFGETHHWFWDFVFYALFGVIITSSVHIAGVLLVFAFLVVPSIVGSLFFEKISHRLFFGWGIGLVLSFVGMVLSYWLDMPSGAMIVVVFTSVPIVIVLGMGLRLAFSLVGRGEFSYNR